MESFFPHLNPTYVIVTVFGLLVPLAALAGRYAVRRQRQETLQNLRRSVEHNTGRNAAFIPSFEFALQKYDLNGGVAVKPSIKEFFFYFATSIIFMAVSAVGFAVLLHDNHSIIFGGLQGLPPEDADAYKHMTEAVVAFAFLGAYIWSIQYLIRRIANFDLSPMSFLRASAQIILACAIAAVIRHFFPQPADGGWAGPMILLAAFLIGFFPNSGLDFLIRKVPQLRLKAVDEDAAKALRSMPVEMIDGIDSQVSFRLAEREIVDVENLATENPVLLCAESPYPLLEVLDWIAQAQLALEVGPKAYKQLRDMGIRTIFALETAVGDPQLEPAALKVLYGAEGDRPKSLAPRIAAMKAHLHVARLDEVWKVAMEALTTRPAAGEPSPPTPSSSMSSSIVDAAHPDRAVIALVLDWAQPPEAIKPIEALMRPLDIEPVESIKGGENGTLGTKLPEWLMRLSGVEPGMAAEEIRVFVDRAVSSSWILTETVPLRRQPLLAVAQEGAEVALGRHPGEHGKSDDDATRVELIVVARRQGLVLCGLAEPIERALGAGLRERLLALMGQEPAQGARVPEGAAQ